MLTKNEKFDAENDLLEMSDLYSHFIRFALDFSGRKPYIKINKERFDCPQKAKEYVETLLEN